MPDPTGVPSPEDESFSSNKDTEPVAPSTGTTKSAPVQNFIKSLMDAHRYVHNRRAAASKH